MRNEILALLVIVLVVTGIGVGSFEGVKSRQTVTTTSTSTNYLNGNFTGGLELRVNINATELRTNQRLGISISLYNPLPSELNLSIPCSTENPSANRSAMFGCPVVALPVFPIAMLPSCDLLQPVGFFLVKGYYNLDSLKLLSRGSPDEGTFDPYDVCSGGAIPEQYVFQPLSTQASLTGWTWLSNDYPHQSLGTNGMNSTFSVNGYWVYPLSDKEESEILTPSYTGCSSPQPCGNGFNYPEVGPIAAHPFSSGDYTLVVEDEWGQTVILHFLVE